MEHSTASSFARRCVLSTLVYLFGLGGAFADTPMSTDPKPGDIYREYTRTMMSYAQWRVTGPSSSDPRAQANLPNATLSLNIGDLQGAIKAEAIIDLWGGHAGTYGKAIRFNNHSWIPIPELSTTPGDGECWVSQPMVSVEIPLSHLVQGNNTFQGTNAGQTCWSFNWGQHGQNGIIVRIYYGPSKAHSTGSITSPSSSGTIGENPTITASTSGNVNRVDFLASYTGWDTDADGIFTGYHSDYHREKTETSVGIKNHVGTDMTSPFSVVWNTDMVPDQAAGSVKVLARIRDASGVWFVTNEVTGLTLHRTNASVKMYHTYDMPQRFTVRVTRQTTTVHFNIPSSDDLSKAVSAKLIMHTFNGIDGDHAAGETHYTKVNSWAAPLYGVDHFYSYDVLTMPPSALKSGTNAVACNSNSTSTGWYCLWPGPGIIVRYSGSAPPPGPATKLAFGTQPSATETDASITPAVTVQIQDASGDLMTTDTRNVTIAIGTNPAGGTLAGTKTVAAVGGVATFSTLSINNAGNGYTLAASASGLTGATSSAFNITSGTPPPPPTGNLLENGGFEGGTSPWRFYTNGTGNSFSVVTDAPVVEGTHKGRVVLGSSVGSNTQLYQTGLTLEAGKPYRVSFQAYASAATSIQFRVIEQDNDYTEYGFGFVTRSLTTGWQTITVDFTAHNFAGTVNDAMLQLYFVSSTPSRTIFLDDVMVTGESGPPPPPTGNLLVNHGFESGTSPWRFYTNGTGNSFASVTGAPVVEGTHKGRVVLGSSIGSNTQLYQTGLTLVAGDPYRVSFQAYASAATTIQFRVIEQDDDYTTYGFGFVTRSLTTGWQTFTVDFTAQNFAGTVTDAMLQFYFVNSSPSRTIYFDDVVVGPPPALLAKEVGANPSEAEGTVAAIEAVPTEYALMQNYPNPFNPSTTITFALPAASHVTLDVYNTIGERVALLVDEFRSQGTHTAHFDAASLPSGMYFYRLTTSQSTMIKKMLLMK